MNDDEDEIFSRVIDSLNNKLYREKQKVSILKTMLLAHGVAESQINIQLGEVGKG